MLSLPWTPRERRLIERLRTPHAVEMWLRSLVYNREPEGETLRSFRRVVADGKAHCLEGALSAAAILENYGHPPLLLDIESRDLIDHVVYCYRETTGWGAVATSKYPGLKGRKPLFRSVRELALSYADPFFDYTGNVKGYAIFDLNTLSKRTDWRFSSNNVWVVQKILCEIPHEKVRLSKSREKLWRRRYLAFKEKNPHEEPPAHFYPGHERWR